MLREERAIVSEIEGTTRDTIEESISIKGIPFKLIDTAGIRDADNEVEKIGINRAKKIADNSDVIIAMFDNSKELNKEDKVILDFVKDKNSIIILNKTDLEDKNIRNSKEIKEVSKKTIEMSLVKEEGLEELYNELVEMFNINDINLDNENIITNIRHKNLIEEAIKDIEKANETLNMSMPIDIIAINIKDVIEDLSKITGETVSEDIIKEIFSKFCLGK